jgi:hypothetical protein
MNRFLRTWRGHSCLQRRDSSRRRFGRTCFSLSSRAQLDPAKLGEIRRSKTSYWLAPHVGPDGIRRPIGNRPVRVFIPLEARSAMMTGKVAGFTKGQSQAPEYGRHGRAALAFREGELRSLGQAEACPTKKRRDESRRCRHECPRHVHSGKLTDRAGPCPACWSLAFRGMQATALCGRQSCLQAAFQAAVQQTTHAVRTYSSDFVFRRHSAAKPEKFVAYRKRRPERPPAGTIACRANGQSREPDYARHVFLDKLKHVPRNKAQQLAARSAGESSWPLTAASGKVKKKVDPAPGCDSTQMRPR